jgi:hypothetical protein
MSYQNLLQPTKEKLFENLFEPEPWCGICTTFYTFVLQKGSFKSRAMPANSS